jgi:hypothetical protein
MGAASYPTLAPLQVSRQRWPDAPWNLRDLRRFGIFGTHNQILESQLSLRPEQRPHRPEEGPEESPHASNRTR